jgi:AraC-like DNA-binding protein
MSLEIRASRLLTRPMALGSNAEARCPGTGSEWREMMALLAAVDDLLKYQETPVMLRRVIELARERIGMERVGLYLRDPKLGRLMRGTFGTDVNGEVTDERGLHHEPTDEEMDALRRAHQGGALWLYYEDMPHLTQERDDTRVVGHGWLGVTPLVTGGEIVGVMYNDTALTHAPVDTAKQMRLALFCGLLANLFANRRDSVGWHPLPDEVAGGSLAQRALRALERDPVVTGERIAVQMGISPGHLARSFKSEMGVSLVEYRNRLRIERFLRSVQHGNESLLHAALDAGFGSYAQFFRVYRKLLGTTPREHLGARSTRAARARRIVQEETNERHASTPALAHKAR